MTSQQSNDGTITNAEGQGTAPGADASRAQSTGEHASGTPAPAGSASPATAPASTASARSTTNSHTSVTVAPDPNDPDMVVIRTRKRKRKKSSKPKSRLSRPARIALIVLAVIVAILAAVGIALAIAVNMGNVNLHQMFPGLQNTPEAVALQDEGQTVEYNGHTYRYNENVVSVLLIGRDDESGYKNNTRPDATCADANILFTFDTETNKMNVIMIPRNSWVPVDLYEADGSYVGTRDLQLTLSHAVLLNSIAECAANTTKSVSYLFYNLPITYYVDIDQQVVKQASSAVGGVQLEALETIPGLGFQVGDTVLLEGDAAYRYVNYRYTDGFESSLERQDRQVQFMKAFIAKLSQLSAPDIVNLYNSVSGDIVSNMGVPEVSYLAYCFATGNNGGVEISSLTGTTDVYVETDGIEYERYYLDETSVTENVLKAFYTQVD